MAKLSKVTYGKLVEARVDVPKLLEDYAEACKKRLILRSSVSQASRSFRQSESSKVERLSLTEAQDFSLQVFAFDSHMAKSALWQVTTWELPEYLTKNAQLFWAQASKPAPVAALKPTPVAA